MLKETLWLDYILTRADGLPIIDYSRKYPLQLQTSYKWVFAF